VAVPRTFVLLFGAAFFLFSADRPPLALSPFPLNAQRAWHRLTHAFLVTWRCGLTRLSLVTPLNFLLPSTVYRVSSLFGDESLLPTDFFQAQGAPYAASSSFPKELSPFFPDFTTVLNSHLPRLSAHDLTFDVMAPSQIPAPFYDAASSPLLSPPFRMATPL